MATSSERAYLELRRRILASELAMGERLGEVELASQLEISRTPIREALRRLSADGLVELENNRGARVSSWTAEDVDEIFVLRALLESHGASLAALKFAEDELDELTELCDEMEAVISDRRGPGLERLNEKNRQFHDRILQASGSPRLPALVASLIQVPLTMRTFSMYSEEAIHRSANHHREMVVAFRARNPSWAGAVMHAHIMAARSEVVSWNDRSSAERSQEEA